jgi:hypothetical protein
MGKRRHNDDTSITRTTPRGLVVRGVRQHQRITGSPGFSAMAGAFARRRGTWERPGETRDKFNMTLARRQSMGGQHADATALRVDARPSFSLHRVHVRHQRSDHRRAKLKMGHLHPFMADNDTFGERFL